MLSCHVAAGIAPPVVCIQVVLSAQFIKDACEVNVDVMRSLQIILQGASCSLWVHTHTAQKLKALGGAAAAFVSHCRVLPDAGSTASSWIGAA